MTREAFEQIVVEEFPQAVPEKFHQLIKNVGFLIEERSPNGDLLGLYHGIAHTARGAHYGEGPTMPDTITLYQQEIEEEARDKGLPVAQVVRETIWHEVAHYFGYDEDQVRNREERRDTI